MTSPVDKVRGFVVDGAGRPLPGVAVTASMEFDDGGQAPIGLLASDSAGYISFDVREPLATGRPGTVRVAAVDGSGSISVTLPPASESAAPAMFTLRTRARGCGGCVGNPPAARAGCRCGRKVMTTAATNLPAIQRPDAADWRLSPSSLVTPRRITLGDDDGCAVPVRSVLPTRRIRFVQIVRRTASRVMSTHGTATQRSPFTEPSTPAVAPVIDAFGEPPERSRSIWLPCEIVEYEQSWEDMGESLGAILYSLPLAPCESVDLAVIEASRTESAVRTDDLMSRENLDHALFRDRTIDESVEGALRERQGGWSLMGGHAGSYSGSWVNVGTFSAVHSLGGTVSHSWGNRSLEAESNQDLHDATVQATSVVRSLKSTVVVQASQTERHQLQTRTVANHNRCHALTIQYYEVLRLVRLRTAHVRTRPGVLIPYTYLSFTEPRPKVVDVPGELGPARTAVTAPVTADLQLVNRLRPQLEGSLLRPALDANFEAVRRLLFFELVDPPAAAPPQDPLDYPVQAVHVTLKRGQYGTGQRSLSLKLRLTREVGDGQRLSYYADFDPVPGQAVRNNDPKEVILDSPAMENDLDDEGDVETVGPWTFKLRWPQSRTRRILGQFEVHWRKPHGDVRPDFTLVGLDVRASAPAGEEVLVSAEPKHRFQQEGFQSFVVPPPGGASGEAGAGGSGAQEPAADPAEALRRQRTQDQAMAWELIGHLHDHRDYYSQRLVAVKDPSWFGEALDAACGAAVQLRDQVDGLPVAVSGQFLAFPLIAQAGTGPDPLADPTGPLSREDVISLPTRGILAEAQLGSCNACEKRDVTRSAPWQDGPCGEPPAIEGVTPGFRGEPANVQPTSLPNAVVQITQPPAAPDPVGLAAAMTLLGRGDAFRDMSGRAELGQLLSGLASGAIDLATARRLAASVSGRQQEAGRAGSGTDATNTGYEPDATRQVDRLDAIRHGRDNDLIEDDEARAAANRVLGGALASNDAGFMPGTGAQPHWNAYIYVVGTDKKNRSNFNQMRKVLMKHSTFEPPWVAITYDYHPTQNDKPGELRKTWKRDAASREQSQKFELGIEEFIVYREIAAMASHSTVRELHFLTHSAPDQLSYAWERSAGPAQLRSLPPDFAAAFAPDALVKIHGCASNEDLLEKIGEFCADGAGKGTILPFIRGAVDRSYAMALARATQLPVWAAPVGVGVMLQCQYVPPADRDTFCIETDPKLPNSYPATLRFYSNNYHRLFPLAAGEDVFDGTRHMKYKPDMAASTAGPPATCEGTTP